jgi:ribonuclease P protein component
MLKKINRLQKNKDFRRIYQRGKSRAFTGFILYYRKSGNKENLHIGFCVSKKIGKAVQRNLIKRRFREACHHLLDSFTSGYDYVFIVRKSALEMPFNQLQADIDQALNSLALS